MKWFILISWMPGWAARELGSGKATAQPTRKFQGKKRGGRSTGIGSKKSCQLPASTRKPCGKQLVVDRDAKADFGKKMEQNRDRLCPCALRAKFSFYGHGWLQPRRSSQPRAFIWNRLRPWSSSNLGRALRFRQSFQPS